MSMEVTELLCNSGNCGGVRTADKIKYLVIHYTGNDGDTARNNAEYFHDNVVKASAHYFVDDESVYRSVPDLQTAWAVGGSLYVGAQETGGGTMYGKITNANSISVELCGTAGDGSRRASEKTLVRAVGLCRELMAKYHISIANVYRHFDVTGKRCPAYLVDEAAWADFRARLTDSTPAPYAKEAVEWAWERGILLGDELGDLKLSQPCTRQQMAVFLHRFWKQLT